MPLTPMEQLWLGEKIIAIFAYIFTGYYTLKLARNKTMQIIGYLGGLWGVDNVNCSISHDTRTTFFRINI